MLPVVTPVMYAVYLVISEHVTCCNTCYVCVVYLVISEHVTCCNTCYVYAVYLVISEHVTCCNTCYVCCLPGDISITESHKTIILLIHIQVLNETLAQEVVKTPEHVQKTMLSNTSTTH